MRLKNTIVLLALIFLLIFQFQNCSKVSFDQVGKKIDKLNDEGTAEEQDDEIVDEEDTDPVCPAGSTLVDGVCVTTIFTECTSFIELNTNVIPSLSSTGVCYYKKLISATPNHASGTFGEQRANDVWARSHEHSGWQPARPFIIGDNTLDLTFLSQRSISLTSSRVGSIAEIEAAELSIDNFILVEVTDANNSKRMLARGTADAEPYSQNYQVIPIRVNDVPVSNFISYAPGGTAHVPVLNITQDVELNIESKIRVRMLDCGGAAEASDMYLIIH